MLIGRRHANIKPGFYTCFFIAEGAGLRPASDSPLQLWKIAFTRCAPVARVFPKAADAMLLTQSILDSVSSKESNGDVPERL
jgi:hypothetical protein